MGEGRGAKALSIAIIVRDEAANLPALFAGLKPAEFSQIVVVDTGSRDGTVELARSLGAEVHAFSWRDDFAAARNAASAHCTGDFILWLDADDRLPEETARRLSELLRAPPSAWRLVVKSPREDGSGDSFRQIRVFPNRRGLVFEGRIHEQLGSACARLGIPVHDSGLEILHTGYASAEIRSAKARRNLSLLRREAEDHPGDPTVAMALGNALCQTGEFSRAKEVFLARIDSLGLEPPDDPAFRRFPCLLSECCAALGENDEAEDWDHLAMEWEPAHFLPAFRQAKREMGRGRAAEALGIFLRIADQTVEVGILAADNASVRRNALGYAALLETKMLGAKKAENARRCLLALRDEKGPLPLDPLFPVEFFRERGETLTPGPSPTAVHRACRGVVGEGPGVRGFGTIPSPLKSPHRSGLSVAMIVKNEAQNIRAAVESFRPVADEIVVNDTGSTDGTQALLDELGVRWFQTEWKSDFSLARNQAIERASRSWILWLDADDRIPADQVGNFRKLKTAPLDRAFGFQVINTQGGLPLGGRFMQVRMFPNHPKLRFRYRVHEQIVHAVAELGLHCFYTETTVHHTGYEDPELKKKKARRNLDILREEGHRLGEEPSLAMSVGDSHYILGEWEQGIAAYRRALEIPNCREVNFDVYAELPACIGRGHQKLGRLGEAMRWFARSRELQPDKIEPAFYEAECLRESGSGIEAEKAFARVAEMPLTFSATASQHDTIRIFSLWNSATLLADRGAEAEAVATLRKLNAAYPQVVEAWHLLGKLLRKKGEEEEAARCFAQAAELNPAAFEALESEGRGSLPGTQDHGGGVNEGKPILLSLCLIVKNEISNLPACLESARGLADEIVVVDTGSTDGTADWAERNGAKVIRTTWENDFSKARNVSLAAASGGWILWLDADDRLLSADKTAIRSLVENHPPDRAYGFLVQNTSDGGKTGTVFNQIRVFPNRPDLRFTAPVHEQILPAIEKAALPVKYLPIRILHTGYADPGLSRAKQARNRALLETQIREGSGVTAVTHYTLGMACLDLDDPEAALRHFAAAAAASRVAGNNPHIFAAAPVKCAVALARLNRHAEALRCLEEGGLRSGSSAIPEAVLVKAQLLQAAGRDEEARAAFEELLSVPETPAFIPVDVPLMKIRALRYLGEYWHARGRRELALRLLQAGLSVKGGRDFTARDLLAAYSEYSEADSLFSAPSALGI